LAKTRVGNSPTRRHASRSGNAAGTWVRHLTAGDVARMLHVDLKTIHNWVKQGHVLARRTAGRHMRFHRAEVVRFLRRFGYPIPQALGAVPPRVLVHKTRKFGIPGVPGTERTVKEGLFATVLEVAWGDYEVLVLNLDAFDAEATRELLSAIRARAETRCLSVVGLSNSASRRRRFVSEGGDAALSRRKSKAIGRTARWLTGCADDPPREALSRARYPNLD